MPVSHRFDRDDRPQPQEDKIIVLSGATWADYQRMLEMRGDHSAPRIAYLEGAIEIMSPSQPHESIKSILGCLVEVWCLEQGIEFSTFGSWTLEDKAVERGVEADECYVFGLPRGALRPDLAIEVVWTSGVLNKLEIYRKLGVREVWFWRRGKLTAHVLVGDMYEQRTQSEVLPAIDLDELASFVDRPTTSQAIRDYRGALQTRAR